jgi:hypothetical protein
MSQVLFFSYILNQNSLFLFYHYHIKFVIEVGICFSRNPISGANALFGSVWPALSGQRFALNEYDVDDPPLLNESADKFEKHFKDMIQV